MKFLAVIALAVVVCGLYLLVPMLIEYLTPDFSGVLSWIP